MARVAGFLALTVAGLTSHDALMMRAAYLAMELIGWLAIVPLSLASPPDFLFSAKGSRFVTHIKRLKEVNTVYAYFNNDVGGHAIKNAQQLRELLG